MKIKKDSRFKWIIKRRFEKKDYWFDIYCNDILITQLLCNKSKSAPDYYKSLIGIYWYRDKMWKNFKELSNGK